MTPAATVMCWGANEHGQLGDGTTTERDAPVEVTGLSGVIRVTAAGSFTCALKGEGEVWCWGANERGQLGDGTVIDRHAPVEVTGLPPALEVEAGGDHVCAITETLRLWCWGANGHGQLGDGTTTDREAPVEVPGLPETFGVAAGTAHTCARAEDKLWCWGANGHGQLGDGTTIERHAPVEVTGVSGPVGEVAAGGETTCADIQNKVMCWGDNEHGQLGDGTTTDRHAPVDVSGLPFGSAGLAVGGSYTCAVSYFAWCWGANEHGQLGDGSTTDSDTPVDISSDPAGNPPIAAGGSHACTVSRAAKVWCWGDNEHGQLGDGSTSDSSTRVGVKALSGPIAVATGGSASCAITGGGMVRCWGAEGGTGGDAASPTTVAGLTGATEIGVGGNHSCALASPTSKVWCWGSNGHGQLGDGTTSDRPEPVEASGLANAVGVAAGDLHSCAVIEGGTVECWGANAQGQLGDGTTTERHAPVEVTGLSGVTEVAAGASFTCALKGEGEVWCWGDDEHGQLGDGTTTDRHSPVEVTGLPPALEIAAGGDHACAISKALEVWCWGANEHGQLGDGTTTDRKAPVEVPGLSDVAQITAGSDHTCVVVTAAGEPFWCWGANEHGQLGDGTTTDRHSPAEVHFLAASSMLAAGGEHTCALLRSGLVECWGSNQYGQLGDGTDTQATSPVEAPVEQRGQTVAFELFGREEVLGDDPSLFPTYSTSGLSVTYASLTPLVCRIVPGEVHLVGLGECKLVATQSGSVRYAPAAPIERRFQVGLRPGTGAISGRVTEEDGGHGALAGVLVCALQDEEEEEVLGQNCALTDAEGGYILGSLPPGEYRIEFQAPSSGPNYVSEYYDNASSWSHAQPVHVTETLTAGVDAALAEGGEMTGTVTALADGEALAEVLVCAEQIGHEFEECETTGAGGAYRIRGLAEGSYVVSFVPPRGEGFRGQIYSGRSNPGEADAVHVVAGGVVGNINAALRPEATISGSVTDSSTRAGLGQVEVCAFELTGFGFEICELTGPMGVYRLTDLPAGEYKVGFFPESLLEEELESGSYAMQYWNDEPSWESADILTLGLGVDAENIDAGLISSSAPDTEPPATPGPTIHVPSHGSGIPGNGVNAPAPGVTAPPKSAAPKHCPAGKKRKKIDGKRRCVRLSKRAHHKHRHRPTRTADPAN